MALWPRWKEQYKRELKRREKAEYSQWNSEMKAPPRPNTQPPLLPKPWLRLFLVCVSCLQGGRTVLTDAVSSLQKQIWVSERFHRWAFHLPSTAVPTLLVCAWRTISHFPITKCPFASPSIWPGLSLPGPPATTPEKQCLCYELRTKELWQSLSNNHCPLLTPCYFQEVWQLSGGAAKSRGYWKWIFGRSLLQILLHGSHCLPDC